MKKILTLFLVLIFSSVLLNAQDPNCPDCPDFMDLNSPWLLKCTSTAGSYNQLISTNNYTGNARGNSHKIMDTPFEDQNAFMTTSGITTYLSVPPTEWDGEPVSEVMRLNEPVGYGSSGYHGAGAVYTMKPTPETSMLMVYFSFIVQLPHETYQENPIFQIRILDSVNNPIPGKRYLLNTGYNLNNNTYAPNPDQNPLADWYMSMVGYDPVIWVNWTPVAFDLREFENKTVKVEIIATNCVYTVHWGYAYYAAKCIPGRLDVKSCGSDSLKVYAPSGFKEYKWLDENSQEIAPRLEQYVISRDTNRTYVKCEMTSYTGLVVEIETSINYYELQADFDYREVHEDCQSKVYFENTSKVRVIGTQGGYRPVEFVEWDFGDGSSDPNEIYQVSPVHTYQNPGNYTVRLILYDPDQECTDTVFQNITIHEVERPVGYDTVSTCAEKLPYQYDAQHSLPNAGTYTITYTAANGCDSITYVTLIIEEPTVRIVSLLDYCDEFFTELEAITEVDNPVFLWNTGDILNKITVSEPGDYSVTVTDVNGCNGENKLNVPACIPNMILPNAISPSDENGVNDYFSIPQVNLVKSLEFSVYDRYGRQVFHTTDKHFKWYGDVDGRLISNTTYTYILIIQDYAKTPPSRITGNITVL